MTHCHQDQYGKLSFCFSYNYIYAYNSVVNFKHRNLSKCRLYLWLLHQRDCSPVTGLCKKFHWPIADGMTTAFEIFPCATCKRSEELVSKVCWYRIFNILVGLHNKKIKLEVTARSGVNFVILIFVQVFNKSSAVSKICSFKTSCSSEWPHPEPHELSERRDSEYSS
jgi:hypothetical protein